MITKVQSFKLHGIEGVPVTVECEITPGVGIHLVGLADVAVKESLLRTTTALMALGFDIPGRRIVINLAPADLHKNGTHYDLPVALAILTASGQAPATALDKYLFAGELTLDGRLRDIPGWLQAARLAATQGKSCILPTGCAKLAARALQGSATIYGCDSLDEAISILSHGEPDRTALDDLQDDEEDYEQAYELLRNWWDTIRGHDAEKRALEIAAAGGHPILLVGTPGSDKKQLARALKDILPPMDTEQAEQVQAVYSAADKTILPGLRPFRAVNSCSTLSALLGGGCGDSIRPGEVSLAHQGILYLEDLAAFPKAVTEALRGPLEDRQIKISRMHSVVSYPADFLPVLSAQPCPCGYYGEGDRCTCTPTQRKLYLSRLSGPVLDHITMQVWVRAAAPATRHGEPCSEAAARVSKARKRQLDRQGCLNDQLTKSEPEEVLSAYPGVRREITNTAAYVLERMRLSVRAYSRILRIARTIADLADREDVIPADIYEAASYRFLDRLDDPAQQRQTVPSPMAQKIRL